MMVYALLLWCLLQAEPTAGSVDFQIIRPGTYHGNEISAVTGEEWIGLMKTDDGFELQLVEIVVEPARDPYMDRDGSKTALRVSVPGIGYDPVFDWNEEAAHAAESIELLFLVSCPATQLTPGPVECILCDSPDLSPDTTVELGSSWILHTADEGLYLSNGTETGFLTEGATEETGESISVVWAGDLDGDGIPDLVVNNRTHYAFRCVYQLFLSGEAEPGKLVKLVAEFYSVSC